MMLRHQIVLPGGHTQLASRGPARLPFWLRSSELGRSSRLPPARLWGLVHCVHANWHVAALGVCVFVHLWRPASKARGSRPKLKSRPAAPATPSSCQKMIKPNQVDSLLSSLARALSSPARPGLTDRTKGASRIRPQGTGLPRRHVVKLHYSNVFNIQPR